MQIKDSKILVLGGWGLVGAAICHRLMEHSPSKLIVSSLRQSEAEDAVAQLRAEYSYCDPNMFVPKWGNIFTRTEWKEMHWEEVLSNDDSRLGVVNDIYDELTETVLNNSALYNLIQETKPDLVIDCINTATAIAYQDIYTTSKTVRKEILTDSISKTSVERMLASDYIPQLIRHVQIFYRGLLDAKTTMYLKIGTSGTGGMGLNIPYTHSEERPSRVLLSKAAVAGAQTLLLFLMARSPDGPLVKEIKPTAAIAWKKIAYDKVYRKGKPIELIDMKLEDAHEIGTSFKFVDETGVISKGDEFKSIFIDTGENGIFSKGEWQAISSLGQMEIVTPEEIATYAISEIRGGNSGHDVIQALDGSTLGPTYRGGMLQNIALKKIEKLEKEHNVESIAFELLGPPRLSKLLYEANIIKKIAGSVQSALKMSPETISEKALEIITNNSQLRSEMLSIGLAILLPDGKKYLRGKEVKIPVKSAYAEIDVTAEDFEKWCEEGWVDLRASNFKSWQARLQAIMEQAGKVADDDTSSRYTYNNDYWNHFDTIDEGKIAGWIFEFEDHGWRFKR